MKVTDHLGQLFASVSLLVACSDTSSGTDAAIDSSLVCTHLQNLRLIRAKAETFGGLPFPGDICIEGRADIACATVGTDGLFEMCAPSPGDFGLRFTAVGFEKTVYLHGPSATPPTFRIGSDAFVGPSYWAASGGTYPPTADGHLVVIASADTTGLSGATIAITPAGTLDVVYLDANNLPDPTRVSTGPSGVGLIPNVPVGDYDIKITSATNPSCTLSTNGWKSPDAAQQVRIPSIAATTVVATLRCVP